MRNNGGRIGVANIPSLSVATGLWGTSFIARQLAGSVSKLQWPTTTDSIWSSVTAMYRLQIENMVLDNSNMIRNFGSAGSTANLGFFTKTASIATMYYESTPIIAGRSSSLRSSGAASGPYCRTAADAAFGFGTGDFAVDGWSRVRSLAAENDILDLRTAGGATDDAPLVYVWTDGSLRYWYNGADRITGSASQVAINTWYYWALAKVSGTTRLYLGTSGTAAKQGSDYSDSNNYGTTRTLWLGCNAHTDKFFSMNFDSLRVTKGNGRGWTGSTIAVPTIPFPDQ